MRARAATAALLLLLAAGCAADTVVSETEGAVNSGGTPGTYDPCLPPPTGVKRGDPFVFGLAFWPTGLISDWGAPYNATSGAPGLNPCITDQEAVGVDGSKQGNYQEYLTKQGVVFGTYMIKVDTLVALRTTRAEINQIWENALKTANAEDRVMSVVAFRGENRSEAQYVVSDSTGRTTGKGIVQQLSLMVSWDRGAFAGFTWYNSGPCDNCGGLTSATCVQTQYEPNYQKYPQSACAWSFNECVCDKGNPLNCPSNNCTAAVYVGHRGSDKPGRPMESGFQIEQINKYSITSFFWKVVDSIFNLLGNSGIGTPGTGTTQSVEPVQPTGSDTTDADLAAGQAQASNRR